MRWKRYRIDRAPAVAWYVAGRKMFDTRYSVAIRSMWGLGHYPIQH